MPSDPLQAAAPDASPPGSATERLESLLASALRPAAAWYLLVLLAGLALGLWPGARLAPRFTPGPPLPALPTVAVAQAAFFLLLYPLVLSRRARSLPGVRRFWSSCAVESAMLLIVAAPFQAAAAWVSDAVWTDCLRAGLAVACLCPLGWSAGRLMGEGRWGGLAILVLLMAALGLPWAQYVCLDFACAPRAAEAIGRLAPATFVWEAAASRRPSLLPGPAWTVFTWLAVAAGLALLTPLRTRSGARPA